MTFLTGVRLPIDIERGAIGGPRFNTTVLELDSGFEKRNQNWQDTRGEWDVGYGILNKFQKDPAGAELDVDDLINFFYTVAGKANSWRLKDWSDFEVGIENGTNIAAQFIAFGDDSTVLFPMFKRYQFGTATPHDRLLTKIVATSFSFFLEGVLQVEGGGNDFTIDIDTGILTMNVAPASTGGSGPGDEQVLTGRWEFDSHVRLDTDNLQINMEMFAAGSWPNVPIVELLGTGL